MKTLIENVKIVTEDEILLEHGLIIEDERITTIDKLNSIDRSSIDKFIDGEGLYLSPGFIDIHNHGNSGVDIMDSKKETLDTMGNFHLRHGVTSFLGTVITSSYENIKKAVVNMAEYKQDNFLGIHLEGPFFSKEKKGAQPEYYIKEPDLEFIEEIYELSRGSLRVVSLAPELGGVGEVVDYLVKNGVKVSLGHSMADYQECKNIIDRGASIATHLYNGMRDFNHREPGIVGASLVDRRIYSEIIYDRVHVHDIAFQIAYRLKGADRLVLISDAMMAAGLGDGSYKLGGQDVSLVGREARLKNGSLAGSVLTLDRAVYNVITYQEIGLVEAVRMASLTGAEAIGQSKDLGSIEAGKYANLIFFDDSINIYKVILRGKMKWERK